MNPNQKNSLFPFSISLHLFPPFSRFTSFSFLFFPFLISLFTLLLSCSSPTEFSKGYLTGTVNLEDLSDHSGITIALYELAYLDTTITRINQEYPHIGVIITQHTEFDHRLQSPIKSTETDIDGSFELTKIPTGIYNLVAQKENFGFKYVYEIEINEGENEISQARCHPEFIEGRSEISELTELTPQSPLFKPIEGKLKKLTPNPSLKIEGKLKNKASEVPLEKGESKGVYSSVILSSCHPERSRRTKDESPNDVTFNSQFKTQHSQLANRSVISTPFDKLRTGSMEKSHNSLLTFHFSRNDTGEYNRDSITLYEEIHISGNISNDIVVAPDHHLIIDDDTVFVPNTSSLTILPGAVIRINPGVDLTIHGNLLAQGEENNMFWITSNHGFEVRGNGKREMGKGILPFTSHLSRNSIELYNSMELSPIASVLNDLIEWGKWDYANTCLLNKVNNLHMQNGIFRNGNCGFYSTNVDSTFCEKLLAQDSDSNGYGGIYFENVLNGVIERNILMNNVIGSKIKQGYCGLIKNNYIYENQIGLELWHFIGTINNNEFYNNMDSDIKMCGNYGYEEREMTIERNNFNSDNGIFGFYAPSYGTDVTINYISYNNFKSEDWFIYDISSNELTQEIDARFNYFDGLVEIYEIKLKIFDIEDDELHCPEIIVDGFVTQPIENCGIE